MWTPPAVVVPYLQAQWHPRSKADYGKFMLASHIKVWDTQLLQLLETAVYHSLTTEGFQALCRWTSSPGHWACND